MNCQYYKKRFRRCENCLEVVGDTSGIFYKNDVRWITG